MAVILHCIWKVFRAGWRPAAGWTSVSVLVANGVVLPLAHLWGVDVPPIDWHQMTGFVATLLGLGVMRTIEKSTGTD